MDTSGEAADLVVKESIQLTEASMAARAKRKSRPMRPRSDAPFPRRQSLYRQP